MLCLTALAITTVLTGCAKKETAEEINTKSMAQIYNEEGTPVNVMRIKAESFQSQLSYDATINGIYESTASAKVSDSVEKILYSVGDKVEKDAVVLTFPKNNISANYYQAKTAYENASATYKRMSTLYNAKGISKQDFDNAKAVFDNALANWNNVNEMVNVKAPISGTLSRMDVQPTDNVAPGDNLFTITDSSRLKGKVWIQERDIAKIAKGKKATATWQDKEISGTITQLDLALNPDKQAFGAIVEFDNQQEAIPSGVNAKVNIVSYEKKDIIVLDRKNISFASGKAYVYLVSGTKALKQEIQTGQTFGNKVEIISGLQVGDTIVTDGNKNISDGTFIRIINQE